MRSSKASVRLRSWAALSSMLTVLGLAGCTALPSQGPNSSDVVASAAATPTASREGYLVAVLDARVAKIVTDRPSPTFQGRFGDYRRPPEPLIGVGDTIGVTIWESSAGGLFSSPVVDRTSPGSRTAVIPEQPVTRDGTITVPFAGRLQVAGMSPPMVERKIVQALSGKAIEPQALVTISRNLSNTATVAGQAIQGARVPLSQRGDKVLDVLASAGGVKAPAHESFITLEREGRTVTVPMQSVLRDPRENIFVRPGDTLTVEQVPQTYTAFGSTGRNAVVPFEAIGITLDQALAKAGGLLEFQSDPAGVFLFRREPVAIARQLDPAFAVQPGETTVPVVYRVDLRDPNTYFVAGRFKVQDKDILYVAATPFTDLQKIFQIVAPALGTTAVARSLAQ